MPLPAHNPIDTEWFTRGTPLDHIGTQTLNCKACAKSTIHECFRVVVGSTIGIGAPFFVKPFMKRASTTGKVGGTRGEVSQCTACDSLWPMNHDGKAVFLAIGFDPEGMVNPSIAYEAQNRQAEQQEQSSTAQTWDPPESRVKKTRD